MKPVYFQEANKVLGPPEGVSEEECGKLPVYSDGVRCMSIWRLSDEDVAKIVETRGIILTVFSGASMPPVDLTVAPEAVWEDDIPSELADAHVEPNIETKPDNEQE